ncbi:unnamed protein product, partial [Staurois parvus]
GGAGPPRRNDRSQAPRRGGQAGRRGTDGHRVIWQGSGLRVNWYDRGHWVRQIGSSGWTAGTGSPGIRSFGLTAGHRVIWQGSGLRTVNRHDSEHRVIRYRIVWSGSTAGHRVIWQGSGLRVNWYDRGHTGSDIGSSGWTGALGHQASGHLA